MGKLKKPPIAKPHGVRYPWEKWFSARGPVTLVRGRDFHCQVHGFAQGARQMSYRKGVRIRLELGDDRVTLTVIKRGLDANLKY